MSEPKAQKALTEQELIVRIKQIGEKYLTQHPGKIDCRSIRTFFSSFWGKVSHTNQDVARFLVNIERECPDKSFYSIWTFLRGTYQRKLANMGSGSLGEAIVALFKEQFGENYQAHTNTSCLAHLPAVAATQLYHLDRMDACIRTLKPLQPQPRLASDSTEMRPPV